MMMMTTTIVTPLSTVAIPVAEETVSATIAPLQTVTCVLQAKMGGLDRVLGALTHRGWIPTRFESVLQEATDTLVVTMQFRTADMFSVHKLVKFLDKQVYVLSSALVEADVAATAPVDTLLTAVKTSC
jgi:hypothetical protein